MRGMTLALGPDSCLALLLMALSYAAVEAWQWHLSAKATLMVVITWGLR